MNKVILFAACLAGSVLSANAQSNVYVPFNTVKVEKNVATEFTVAVENTDDISALQANFTAVPENVTFEWENARSLTGDSIKGSATSNLGSPVVVTYNYNVGSAQSAFNSMDNLFAVKVTADKAFSKGEMTITPIASKIGGDGVSVNPTVVAVKLNGDADNTGEVNAADAIAALKVYVSGGYDYVADADNSGEVNAADAIKILKIYVSNSKQSVVDLGE